MATEDDECFAGVCNPDDYVGSITLTYDGCAGVFHQGANGWTSRATIAGAGDVASVRARSWCYECEDAIGCVLAAAPGVTF